MTDAEAEEMLEKLRAHYGEPVLPVSRYCAAFRDWLHAVHRNPQQFSWAEHVPKILLGIGKSSWLFRRIYRGEALRTVQCPQHTGHWAGVGLCDHGCHETGWLPAHHVFDPLTVNWWYERDDMGVRRERNGEKIVCSTCGGIESATIHVAGGSG